MTWRLMAFFTFVFVFGTVVSSIIDGSGGFVTTTLTANLAKNATTANVTSTTGFYSAGNLSIEGELIPYIGKAATTFTFNAGQQHRAHGVGKEVMTEVSGTLNSLLGFDIKSTYNSYGLIVTALCVPGALLHAFWHITSWDYAYLNNDVGHYIRLFGFVLSAGFVIAVVALLRGY